MDWLLNFLFPRRCVGCGRLGSYLCSDCQETVEVPPPICPMCCRPALDGITHPSCRMTYGLDGLVSFFNYRGVVKKALKHIKYRWVSDIAQTFIAHASLNESVLIQHAQQKQVTLVPVPLHISRQRWRGFNQSALFAKLLAHQLNLSYVSNLLIRIRKTKTQTELKGSERVLNVRGAFALNTRHGLEVKNKTFIIVDDVWTTGSTMRECAKVLKRSNARWVTAITIAR